jgi:hypothetical protein
MKVLEKIKEKIEFMAAANGESAVLHNMLEDPPEYEDLRDCVYDIYKLVCSAIGEGESDAQSVDESSIRRGNWFDSDGWLLKPIPMGCIYDLSGSGQKDDQAEYWVEELGFDDKFPRDKAIDWLRDFGAWEVEELEQKSDTELAQIVLWEFCNELWEQANEQGDDILEEVGLPIEVEEWEDADWTLFQTELALVSLNR